MIVIHWKLLFAILIGFIFVYRTNLKTRKKLKDHFDKKEKEGKNNENIY